MEATWDDYRWLVSEEASTWHDQRDATLRDDLKALQRLRRHLTPARAALVVETWQLRERGRVKFALADRMFFTRRSLQQATDGAIARYKASRIPLGQPVWDLCCGIGGDLLELALQHPVVGLDRDPVMILLAEANQRACAEFGSPVEAARVGSAEHEVKFHVADVGQAEWAAEDFLHIDPDRRPDEKRVATRLTDYEPGEPFLRRLLAHPGGAAMKVAPAARIPEAWEGEVEREWISSRGECRQQVVWAGIHRDWGAGRRATRLGNSGEVLGEFAVNSARNRDRLTDEVDVAEESGTYLYDPDPSLSASGLVDAFAQQFQLQRLHPQVAYLTGQDRVDHPLVATFRVLSQIPFDRRRVKRLLESFEIGRLEVKKRGVDVDPRQLARLGRNDPQSRPGTLILSPGVKGVSAILAERLPEASFQ